MRETHKIQPTLTEPWLDLPHAKELKVISDLLRNNPMLSVLVAQDLSHKRTKKSSAGITGEQVLRASIIKQMNGFSYEELAFHLADSQTFRVFCRFGLTDRIPKRSSLAQNIKRVKATTWEQVNRILVKDAQRQSIEKGRKVRIDSTVVETHIHAPSDSSLLFDCVRVLHRLMVAARELSIEGLLFPNRTKRAKRRWLEIARVRGKRKRRRLYRDLVNITKEIMAAAMNVQALVAKHKPSSVMELARAQALHADLRRFLQLTVQVIEQTSRRVFDEETVPVSEKLVSIFEEHTDIIVKKRRETQFGHKLTLTGGASSMILDCIIAQGNPADASQSVQMIERQIDLYGRPPLKASFDGGFASKANLQCLKNKGVRDVVFHKKRGLEISDMAKSPWVFKRLRDFRAGIEGCISFLKRIFGLSRCNWRSLRSFKSYVWASVVSYNLLNMARHLIV